MYHACTLYSGTRKAVENKEDFKLKILALLFIYRVTNKECDLSLRPLKYDVLKVKLSVLP